MCSSMNFWDEDYFPTPSDAAAGHKAVVGTKQCWAQGSAGYKAVLEVVRAGKIVLAPTPRGRLEHTHRGRQSRSGSNR